MVKVKLGKYIPGKGLFLDTLLVTFDTLVLFVVLLTSNSLLYVSFEGRVEFSFSICIKISTRFTSGMGLFSKLKSSQSVSCLFEV